MSWDQAKIDAAQWLSTIPLPSKLRGEFVDLRPHLGSLKATGGFREMVKRAIERELKRRGAMSIIMGE